MSEITVSISNAEKSFGGIHALKDISIDFYAGEVHALVGENGAGKSTLCKVLSGAHDLDSGKLTVYGTDVEALTPQSAKDLGIGMIYQEFNLVSEMAVYENIFLGKEIRNGVFIDKNAMITETKALFERLNIKIDPQAKIKDLPVAYCQMVEIAKTLSENAKILIFDEPTAPLTSEEIDALFAIIRKLKSEGMTIIYISHRMDEIKNLSDRITVMRDGCVVKTMMTCDTSMDEIIRLMIGRTISETFPKRLPSETIDRDGEPILEIKNLCSKKLKNINLKLYKGEILGLAGLVGSGRTEILRALFGADPITSGEIFVNGEKVRLNSPSDSIKQGISLVPEDRKRQGLHLDLSVGTNLSLSKIKEISKATFINEKEEKESINKYINALSIKYGNIKNPVSSLSGGNQQKVVVSKWLLTGGDIILFDEPTRGIDVGAKKEIYELMDNLRKEGKAIIMVSSELPEIIGLCDRTIVMYEGEQKGEVYWEDMTQEKIMRLAADVAG